MKPPIDVSEWTRLAAMTRSEVFLAEPGVVAIIPEEGVRDNEELAREHLTGLEQRVAELGGPHGIVVYIDRLGGQDAGARRVWASANPGLIHAVALVCSSALARAIGSFFLGLKKPAMPTQMFPDHPKAAAWIRERAPGRGT